MSLPSRTTCRSAKPAGWLMTNLVILLCGRLKIAAFKGVRTQVNSSPFHPCPREQASVLIHQARQVALVFALQRDSTSSSANKASRYDADYILLATTLRLSSKVPFNHDPAVSIRPGPRQLWYVRTTRAIPCYMCYKKHACVVLIDSARAGLVFLRTAVHHPNVASDA